MKPGYGVRRLAAALLIVSMLMSVPGTALAGGLGVKHWRERVRLVRLFRGGNAVLRKGQYGYVLDIKSGYVIRVKRLGGHYHMDLEPADRASGRMMKKLGKSWHARPAILYANGHLVACSINTKPHGRQTIRNNGFRGMFCLHMMGSRTHGKKRIRRSHQQAIEKAFRWAHG